MAVETATWTDGTGAAKTIGFQAVPGASGARAQVVTLPADLVGSNPITVAVTEIPTVGHVGGDAVQWRYFQNLDDVDVWWGFGNGINDGGPGMLLPALAGELLIDNYKGPIYFVCASGLTASIQCQVA